MKRLLAYLFIVLCLGLTFNVNANHSWSETHFCIKKKGDDGNWPFYANAWSGSDCPKGMKEVSKKKFETFKKIIDKKYVPNTTESIAVKNLDNKKNDVPKCNDKDWNGNSISWRTCKNDTKNKITTKEISQTQNWTIENIRELEKAVHNQNESESILFDLYQKYKFTPNNLKYAPRDYVTFKAPKGRALLYQSILHAIDKNPTYANDIIVINSFYLKKAFERDGLENAFVFELSKLLKKAYPVQNYEIFYKNNIEPKIIQIAKAEPSQTQKVVQKNINIELLFRARHKQFFGEPIPVFFKKDFNVNKNTNFEYELQKLYNNGFKRCEKIKGSWGSTYVCELIKISYKDKSFPDINYIFDESGINIKNVKLDINGLGNSKTQISKAQPTITPKKKVKVAKVEDPKQEEFKPENKDIDNDAPVIEIAQNIIVDSQAYTLKGKVKDKSQIYLTIDGRRVQVKKGKFELERFNIDPDVVEEVKIVAIDKWNNRAEKTIKVTINLKSTDTAKVYENLNPNKVKAKIDNNKIAIIIGIEKYENLTNLDAKYANRDAKAFRAYATRALGVKPSNIKMLIDDKATRSQALKAFKLWLPKISGKGGKEIHIFFAGHGLASDNGEDLYILPQDGESSLLEDTAISRVELISLINKVNPKSVTLFFDTCYSGQTRDERMLVASLRPIRIVADEQETPNNYTIFTASNYDQTSGSIEEAEHGMFSYYLMKGLEGKADENKDKQITNGELIAYLKDNVSQEAFTQNRQQDPMLAGDPNKVLMSFR
ncbi:MAG: caspase family protein [Alphaproteobacteria bacterium]|nr:caspase family protein [Alphaproteobacteria bacterium]